jgi:catecholate siderophore receptor
MPHSPDTQVPSAVHSTLRALASRFLAGSALSLVFTLPAEAQAPAANAPQQPEQVIIQGQRPGEFKIEVPNLSKLTESILDTPQSIEIISDRVLQDRAVSNLNDALRNVPGISLGAGEFSWQGNNPSIRGFVARTDMFLDGLRDFGSYYRDAFNLQQIEVLEGPSSILFGRGSTGGVINQVSKLPTLDKVVAGTLTGGTDYTRRATADIGEPLPDLAEGAAFRLTAMGHQQKHAGRNVAEESRFGFAPSLALGLGTPTRLTAAYFHQSANDVPDYGLPWFGSAPAPVPRQSFYGFTSDFLKTGTDIATFKAEHDYSARLTVHNQLRYAYYTRDFRITEPIVLAPLGTPLASIAVSRNIWSGNSIETMIWDQADVTVHFDTGAIQHSVVAGIEGGRETSKPEFDNSSGVPTVPLLDPDPHLPFIAAATFPRFTADTTGTSFGAYAIDTVKFGEQWEVNLGLRWDYFAADYKATSFSTTTPGLVTGNDSLLRIDRMPSYRAALVYKPEANASVYLDYGTSFNPSAETLSLITGARQFATSNAFLAPEQNQTVELGTKWDLLNNQLSLTGAVFRLEKQNARVPDPNNAGFNTLEGTQRVDGFSLNVRGRLTEDWQITAGYTYLDSHVVKSAPGAAPMGSALTNTPKNALTFFTEYRLGGGFEAGGGGQYVSSRLAQNVPPIKMVPGYWTFDAMAKYDLSEKMSLQLNMNNIFDKYYYDALHPFHVVPGAGRTALLTLNFKY